MPGYQTRLQSIPIVGCDDLLIRSLLDDQQFDDRHGAAARLGIPPAQWGLFGMVWPSGLQLADLMAKHPVTPGERILEIGCGLGLASLVGHRRGADVTACDVHPLAGLFLRANARLNGLSQLRYRHGPWRSQRNVGAAFDLVVGSDLLYAPDSRGDLADFVDRHASAAAEVWIVDPDRDNRPAFHRQMAKRGFARQESRLHRAATDDRDAYRGRVLSYRRA